MFLNPKTSTWFALELFGWKLGPTAKQICRFPGEMEAGLAACIRLVLNCRMQVWWL